MPVGPTISAKLFLFFLTVLTKFGIPEVSLNNARKPEDLILHVPLGML